MKNNFSFTAMLVARESRGLTQQELSDLTGISQYNISRIENGTMIVDEMDVEKIASALKYPINFFYRNLHIFPPNLHYRKKALVPAKIIARVEAIMNIYKTNIEELLKSVQYSNFHLPSSDDVSNLTPIEAAKYLRTYWNIPKGPIGNLTKLLESKGIIVIHFNFQTDLIDGRSILTSTGMPIIFLNSEFSADRQRFTLAHELGHIIMHVYSFLTYMVDVEDEAFLFAAEFLAPKNEIYPFVKDGLTIAKLADLKRHWKISMQSIVYWAQKMEAITSNQARYLWSQFSSLRIKKNEPVEIERESPSFIYEMVDFYLNKMHYTIDKLSEKLCLRKDEFEESYLPIKGNLRLVR